MSAAGHISRGACQPRVTGARGAARARKRVSRGARRHAGRAGAGGMSAAGMSAAGWPRRAEDTCLGCCWPASRAAPGRPAERASSGAHGRGRADRCTPARRCLPAAGVVASSCGLANVNLKRACPYSEMACTGTQNRSIVNFVAPDPRQLISQYTRMRPRGPDFLHLVHGTVQAKTPRRRRR